MFLVGKLQLIKRKTTDNEPQHQQDKQSILQVGLGSPCPVLQHPTVNKNLYDNRMEVYSPGGMMDGSLIQHLNPMNVPSKRRNPLLAYLCNIKTMRRRAWNYGLKAWVLGCETKGFRGWYQWFQDVKPLISQTRGVKKINWKLSSAFFFKP